MKKAIVFCILSGLCVLSLIFSACSSNGEGDRAAVTGVRLDNDVVSIGVGSTAQLNALVLPGYAADKSVSWTSNDESIATVNSSGLVTGIASGRAMLTVTTADRSYTASCQIYVWYNISFDASHADYTQVAMDNNGNAIVVWRQDNEAGYEQVFMSEYRNNEWTDPDPIDDNIGLGGEVISSLQVAMDNNGSASIVWDRSNEAGDVGVFMSEYRNDEWKHPNSFDDNISLGGDKASYPDIAMDDHGNALIVWSQYNYENKKLQIFMSEYRNDKWKHPNSLDDNISPVKSTDGGTANFPQIAMNGNGDAIIVWSQYKGDNGIGKYQIYMSEYHNNEWTHPESLDDNISLNGENAYDPQVAMDDNGNAIVVWHQKDKAGYNQIYMSEYRNNEWTHPESLDDNISLNGNDAYSPKVVMDDNGDAIIVWYQKDEEGYKQIFMSEYRNNAWTHPDSLDSNISPDLGSAFYPQVAMDNNGNAIIVWCQKDEAGYKQIFMSTYQNNRWTHPDSLDSNISPDRENASYPQVAMNDTGNAIIVWHQDEDNELENEQILMMMIQVGQAQ